MAQKLWTEAIDKNVDWSNVDGNGTPASGEVVQNFLKDTLQQKFGFLYQDRQNLTNYIFADRADYELWATDEATYSNLVLARFKAPADAMVRNISALSSDVSVTTLLESKNRIIKFNFYTVDSSNNAVMENTSMRMTITHGGVSQSTAVVTIPFDKTNWNNAEIGTHYEINVDEYLTEAGPYRFTIVLTGVGTQASTTLTYDYNVVNLNISIDNYDYSAPVDSNSDSFGVPYTISGAAGIDKALNIAIDGEYLDQSSCGWPGAVSSGDTVTSRDTYADTLYLYIKNTEGELLTWKNPKNVALKDKVIFSPGKHTLQINTSIASGTVGESFYSQTRFVNFVVYDSESIEEFNYLLYSTTTDGGALTAANEEINLTENQYNSLSLSVAVVNTRKSPVNLKYTIASVDGSVEPVEKTVSGLPSGEINKLDYTFNNAGNFTVDIVASSANSTNSDSMRVNVTITPFAIEGETIGETTKNLHIKYEALNRSNTEDGKDVWVNTAPTGAIEQYKYPATFSKVFWNEQSGWDGKALILKNGSTVTLPINLFSEEFFTASGLTFEIDFETFDVQDDNALVLNYEDPAEANASYIKITATAAMLKSKLTMPSPLKTNFKDGTRNKIAFVFNPTTEVVNGKSTSFASPNPNLVMIYVNGILDRATKWGTGSANSDTVLWNQPTVKSITIGNPSGACGVKIYSIRVYKTALEPDEAFMNYVSDQGADIPRIMKKNHVIDESGNISFELCKTLIPTLVISTDFVQMNGPGSKKDNTQYEAQFFDPTDHSLNFYLRNGWISRQGTSSMNYPTKNLRPYMNKKDRNKDGAVTFPYIISTNDELKAGLPGEVKPERPSFNTEFWPISQYEGHEDDVVTWLDNTGILPYSVNSKEVKTSAEEDVTLSLHQIGDNLSRSYQKRMAKMYAKGINDEQNQIFQDPEPIYYEASSGIYRIINPLPNEDGTPNPNSVNDQIDEIIDAGGNVYISAYRSLLRKGWTVDSDEYWKYVQQLRFSGQKLFTRSAKKEDDVVVLYSYKKAKGLKKGTEYFGLGACWRQYDEPGHQSGWTDRWTLKADYAESSNTHNGGVGRLWGNALRNAKYNGTVVGITKAQQCGLQKYSDIFIDIRTSCDCKPIVLFIKEPVGYDKETGKVLFGTPTFAGIYNIMTDKGSTKLFGFEDIKGTENETLFSAKDVQCVEVSSNSTLIGQGLAVNHTGTGDVVREGADIGKGREIWNDDINFEPRWPECGGDTGKYDAESNPRGTEGDNRWNQDEVYGVPTDRFETLWNWVNFTRKAVNYTVSGQDGYSFSQYVKFEGENDGLDAAIAYKRANPDKNIYITYEASGNTVWAADGVDTFEDGKTPFLFYTEYNPADTDAPETQAMQRLIGRALYRFMSNEEVDLTDIKKTVNPLKIGDDPDWGSDVYKVAIPGFDATYRFTDPETGWDEVRAQNFFVEVYMKKQNNRFYYKEDITGEFTQYNGTVSVNDDDHLMKSSIDGLSFAGKTYMDFFKETKWDHLDVYKVAAYFIYFTRFGAVDQLVKNCMITTEDGKHWYYINYDNDTVLGVRNDAVLVFNWDFNRNSYDWTNNSWSYQGVRSVLWNNLEQDDEFMTIVRTMDGELYTDGLLSATTVLEYLNDRGCDTWNERIYNSQEEIKYLSTFRNNFSTEKYLAFLQGNRKSHRIWWVTNRWELIDAQWSTGSYAQKALKFYESIPNANAQNVVKFMNITAASKYYFTMTIGTGVAAYDYTELEANQTYTFSAAYSISQNDPLGLIGPHKIKVLNFRPATGSLTGQAVFAEPYTINDRGTTRQVTWIEDAGTTMVKLLIGNGRDVCPVSTIGGVAEIASLEELDISGCNAVAAPAVTKLRNLRRFRANNSTVTSFEPSEGSTFYEISLPHSNLASGSSLLNLVMKNVRLEHQPVDEYVVYQPGIEGSDELPYTETLDADGKVIELGGIYDNDALMYTSESQAIFDMKPTYKLSTVILHNVEGLDTQKFVFDWYAAVNANPQESLSTKDLSLQGIDWKDIKVSELIKIIKGYDILNLNAEGEPTKVPTFNIGSFAGTVAVKSDDEAVGDTITLDEYNLIIKYFGEEVFIAGNELQIVTGENTFYQPTTDSRTVLTTIEDAALRSAISPDINVYEVIRGDEFKVKATIFPVTGKRIVYVLTSITASGTSTNNPTADYTYSDPLRNITLKTNAAGVGIFNADDLAVAPGTANAVFAITTSELNDEGKPTFITADIYDTSKTIYVNVVNRVIPNANNIDVKFDGVSSITYNIVDTKQHTVSFDMGPTVNAPIKSITAAVKNFDNADYILIDKENWTSPSTNVYEFKFNGVIPKNAIRNAEVSFRFTFDKGTTGTVITKDVIFNINPIYPESIKVYKAGTDIEVGANINLTSPGTNDYTIKVLPADFNVAINDLSFVKTSVTGQRYSVNYLNYAEPVKNEEKPGEYDFSITVKSNKQNNSTFESFACIDAIAISTTDIYGVKTNLKFNTEVQTSIIYPDNMYIAKADKIAGEDDLYEEYKEGTNDETIDIYLTNNEAKQIKVAFLPHDTSVGDYKFKPSVDYNVIFNPAESGAITWSTEGLNDVTDANIGDYYTMVAIPDTKGEYRLTIPAKENKAFTLTLNGSYQVRYDGDATEDELIVSASHSFTINIIYSFADATNYEKLDPSAYYLVDDSSNYYKVDLDADGIDRTALEGKAALIRGYDINIVGFGRVNAVGANIIPYFMMFRFKDVDKFDKYTGTVKFNDKTFDLYSSLHQFMPITMSSLFNTKYVPSSTDVESRKPFFGYFTMNLWLDAVSRGTLAGEIRESRLYELVHMFDDNTRIATYIPSFQELTSLLGADDVFVNIADEVMTVLSEQVDRYADILLFDESNIELGKEENGAAMQGVWANYSSSEENPIYTLVYLTSNTIGDAESTGYMYVFFKKYGVVAGTSATPEYGFVYLNDVRATQKATGILPFLKVS